MTVTSRTTRGKLSTKKASVGQTPTETIVRTAHVEELRRQVASGRYKVEPYRLALRMLARALKSDH